MLYLYQEVEAGMQRHKYRPLPQSHMDQRVQDLNRLCQEFQKSNPGLNVNTAMQAAIAALQANPATVRTTPGIFSIPRRNDQGSNNSTLR
jgi:hypothetical protein